MLVYPVTFLLDKAIDGEAGYAWWSGDYDLTGLGVELEAQTTTARVGFEYIICHLEGDYSTRQDV